MKTSQHQWGQSEPSGLRHENSCCHLTGMLGKELCRPRQWLPTAWKLKSTLNLSMTYRALRGLFPPFAWVSSLTTVHLIAAPLLVTPCLPWSSSSLSLCSCCALPLGDRPLVLPFLSPSSSNSSSWLLASNPRESPTGRVIYVLTVGPRTYGALALSVNSHPAS